MVPWHRDNDCLVPLAQALIDAGMICQHSSPDMNADELLRFFRMAKYWRVEWLYFRQHGTMAGFQGYVDSRKGQTHE